MNDRTLWVAVDALAGSATAKATTAAMMIVRLQIFMVFPGWFLLVLITSKFPGIYFCCITFSPLRGLNLLQNGYLPILDSPD